MIRFSSIPARKVTAGDVFAFIYRTSDDERWVRAETVRKVVRHRDGSTTVETDYTKHALLGADIEVRVVEDGFNPMPLSEAREVMQEASEAEPTPAPEPVRAAFKRPAKVRPTFPDTREGAKALIRYAVAAEWRVPVLMSLDSGSSRLVPDPQVQGVWGVLDTDDTARMVLYMGEADFEMDTEWFAAVSA